MWVRIPITCWVNDFREAKSTETFCLRGFAALRESLHRRF
jgi:hypothetical protein